VRRARHLLHLSLDLSSLSLPARQGAPGIQKAPTTRPILAAAAAEPHLEVTACVNKLKSGAAATEVIPPLVLGSGRRRRRYLC